MTGHEWAAYDQCLVCGAPAGGRCRSRRRPYRDGRRTPPTLNTPHAGRPHRTRQETR